MCAAARRVSETVCRCDAHFRVAILEPARAVHCTVYSERPLFLLSAPKVPFLNSALPEECPVCLARQNRIDDSVPSALDEARARAEPTPGSVQRCASPSVASLDRWR